MFISLNDYFTQTLFPYLFNNELNCLIIPAIIPIIDLYFIQEDVNENGANRNID